MEGQPKLYTKGQRWHRTTTGEIRPCYAQKRACPYSQHFDTKDQFESHRQLSSDRVDFKKQVVFFTESIGGPLTTVPDDIYTETKNLRECADTAKRQYQQWGVKPVSTLGIISVYYTKDKHIDLKRETYDYKDLEGNYQVGVRYYARYFNSPNTYYDDTIALNSKSDFELMDFSLQEFASDTVNARYENKQQDQRINETYQKMMQSVAEIEIMARGAEQAYSQLGIDLFDHSDPTVLSLTSSYSHGVIQTYDITDALKVHAVHDEQPKTVTLSFSDSLDGSDSAYWTVDRNEEGEWYVGANTPKAVIAQKCSSPEEASTLLRKIMGFYKVPEGEQDKRCTFVAEIMREVEPAIHSYEQTVAHRVARGSALTPSAPPPQVKKSFSDKLLGMFGN